MWSEMGMQLRRARYLRPFENKGRFQARRLGSGLWTKLSEDGFSCGLGMPTS